MAFTTTSNPFIEDQDAVRERREENPDRPDLKAPPSSPEPDQRAMDRGLENLERVKPY